MIPLLRALARLVTIVLLVTLALLGLAVAIFSIQGDSHTLSLPTLARHFGMPQFRGVVGDLYARLERGGQDWVAAGYGLAAVVAGLLLLLGTVVRPRERLVLLEENEAGSLGARARALSRAASARLERARGVVDARTRVRAHRHGTGGVLRVSAAHPPDLPAAEAREQTTEAVGPLAESFGLRLRVRARPQRKRRVR